MGLFLYVMLAIGGVVGGGLGVGFEKLFVTPKAVAEAERKANERCEGEKAQIQSALLSNALDKVDARDAALRNMTPTPDTREGIKVQCVKEAACRK